MYYTVLKVTVRSGEKFPTDLIEAQYGHHESMILPDTDFEDT